MLAARGGNAACAFRRYIVEMGCRAANDGAECNDAVGAPRCGDLVHGQGHLVGARDTNDVDIRITGTMAPQARHRALDQ